MKKAIWIVIILVVLGLVVWKLGGTGSPSTSSDTTTSSGDQTVSAPVSEATKVNDKLTIYKNDELGFSVKYPTVWERGDSALGVTFVIPTDKTGNTVRKLETKIQVSSGKCAFPPVTTVKERSTLKNGDYTFNMISMSNSVQGANYFDRMYSLQHDTVCYILSFSSVTASPTASGYKGSEATQITNNNKAIIEAADQAFTNMVKSFEYVQTPAGQDETQVVPTKK